jgi:hypothetical protein
MEHAAIQASMNSIAAAVAGAVKATVLAVHHHLEQENRSDRPRRALEKLRVPYTPKDFNLNDLSDNESEYYFRYACG